MLDNHEKAAVESAASIKKKLLYHETFKTEDDKKVLVDILNELGFFDSYNTKKEDPVVYQTKQYIARYLLHQIGVWDNALDVVQGLVKSSREV